MPFFVYILSFGAFVLGTSEFMVAGMMPSLMSAFSISEEMAGGLVSLYALGMVVGGPVLAWVLTREGVSGKRILLGAMGIYVIAQCGKSQVSCLDHAATCPLSHGWVVARATLSRSGLSVTP